MMLPFVLAFAAGAAFTGLVRRAMRRLGAYANPTPDRWHQQPVAKFGGVAIIAATLAGASISAGSIDGLVPVWVCASLMFALGLADDILVLRPMTKLAGQLMIAALLIHLIGPFSITGWAVLDLLLAFAWVIGITNAFNLLDNMDGLAAGIAAIAGLFYLGVFAGDGASATNGAMAALVGSTAGFLLYNFRPASIFMGDCGSLFIGGFLASATLLTVSDDKAHLATLTAIPVLILLIPIFDVFFVTLTRRIAGRSPLAGGRDHTSHRLVGLGISERRAVLFLYALAALGGGVALGVRYSGFDYASVLIGLYLLVVGAVGVLLGHVEAYRSDEGRDKASAPLLSDLTHRHRLYEVVLDLGLISVAYYAAFRIRFDDPAFAHFLPPFLASFPIVVGCQLAALWIVGKYRNIWWSPRATEFVSIAKGVGLGVASSVIAILFLYRFETFSRGVFLIDAALLVLLLMAARVAIGALDEYFRRHRVDGTVVLIYGAGRRGAALAHELLRDARGRRVPAGFIDDDPAKHRRRVEGLPVLGGCDDLDAIIGRRRPSEVIIGIERIDEARVARCRHVCGAMGVALKRLRYSIEDVVPMPEEVEYRQLSEDLRWIERSGAKPC
jgi:UDP-GlcNAc:undecaprenyl-phosphate/decaprenyl-phosphate GlcNAc-1-phosphate transferase